MASSTEWSMAVTSMPKAPNSLPNRLAAGFSSSIMITSMFGPFWLLDSLTWPSATSPLFIFFHVPLLLFHELVDHLFFPVLAKDGAVSKGMECVEGQTDAPEEKGEKMRPLPKIVHMVEYIAQNKAIDQNIDHQVDIEALELLYLFFGPFVLIPVKVFHYFHFWVSSSLFIISSIFLFSHCLPKKGFRSKVPKAWKTIPMPQPKAAQRNHI